MTKKNHAFSVATYLAKISSQNPKLFQLGGGVITVRHL